VRLDLKVPGGPEVVARLAAGADGSGLEQLTFDEFVNWFPHISPDGRWATYISFPPGTAGHPPNVRIDVKIVALDA
jgi:Tol biopolymer transport system component